jgi:hypothetical protein
MLFTVLCCNPESTRRSKTPCPDRSRTAATSCSLNDRNFSNEAQRTRCLRLLRIVRNQPVHTKLLHCRQMKSTQGPAETRYSKSRMLHPGQAENFAGKRASFKGFAIQ